MLRRRLLIVFGSLVALLAIMAVCGLWVLYDMLQRLDHIKAQAASIIDKTSQLSSRLTMAELDLYELRLGKTRYLDTLIDDVESVRRLLQEIGEHYLTSEPEAKAALDALLARYPEFENGISSLATAQDENLSQRYIARSLTQTAAMRRAAEAIRTIAWQHGQGEQQELADRFRWLVLGTAIGGMLVINVSIMVLLRAAGMVLTPVGRLVEASRRLSDEQFDYRARLDREDEFSELARAYNELAERMQTSERRKMETIGQMALTLNHKLNNAMGTIELQLQIMGRQADDNEKFKECLTRVREVLRHMAETVESLKRIRRIVLTDYVGGTKMLDLEQSVQEEPEEPQPIPDPAQDWEGL